MQQVCRCVARSQQCNTFLQEELSTTLSELEQKMAVLDADLTWRAIEAEKLQVTSCKWSSSTARRWFCKLTRSNQHLSWLVPMTRQLHQLTSQTQARSLCGPVQASLEAATGTKAPPPPTYNGTKVHAAIGDRGSGTTNPLGGSVPIDNERLRAPLAAAATGEVPASRRPAGSKAFGKHVRRRAGMQACSAPFQGQ